MVPEESAFCWNIVQDEQYFCASNRDEEVYAIEPYSLSPVGCRQQDEILNAIERKELMCINNSFGWLKITLSALRVFYFSQLQQ